jgi:hypothetical protein
MDQNTLKAELTALIDNHKQTIQKKEEQAKRAEMLKRVKSNLETLVTTRYLRYYESVQSIFADMGIAKTKLLTERLPLKMLGVVYALQVKCLMGEEGNSITIRDGDDQTYGFALEVSLSGSEEKIKHYISVDIDRYTPEKTHLINEINTLFTDDICARDLVDLLKNIKV